MLERDNQMEENTLTNAISEYKKVKKKLKRTPLKKDLSSKSQSAIIQKYGLYRCFLQAMGDYTRDAIKHFDRGITDLQMVEEIQALYHELGYPPRESQYIHARTATKRLGGSWRAVLKTCHIKATFVNNSVISKQEVIYKGQKEVEKYHRMPTWREMYQDHFPANQIMKYWHGIDDFAKEFNLQTERSNRKEKVEQDIINAAKQLINESKRITVKNIVAASDDKDLTPSRINNFIQTQFNHELLSKPSLIEYLKKQGLNPKPIETKKILVCGETFSNWLEAEKKTGINAGTLQQRIAIYGNDNKIILCKGRITKKEKALYAK